MTFLQSGVLGGLAVWLGLTVVWNIPGCAPRLGRHFSRIGLGRLVIVLPTWNFFAPRPGNADYCLVYRDQDQTGTTTQWRELRVPRPHPVGRAVWNPHSRQRKVIHDAMSHLARLLAEEQPLPRTRLVMSLPYLVLLTRVSSEPAFGEAVSRQFAVLRYRLDHRAPTAADLLPVVVSYFHRLQ